MKKAGTLIGIILGAAAIFGAFLWEGGSADMLFLLPPMLIVFGGTLAAGLAGSSVDHMKRLPSLIKISFFPKKYDHIEIITQIVELGTLSRKEGILALEDKLESVKHPYLKKMFEMCVDGANPDTIEEVVHNEMYHISQRHDENINLFVKLGGYSPTMGIIGTVMGLIATLASAGQEPIVLIRHIASAFIATMWGIIMANIFWLPIGDKLRLLHDQEMRLYEIMLDGVKSVQTGEIPTVVLARLSMSLPMDEQKEFLRGKNVTFASGIRSSAKSNPSEEAANHTNMNNQDQINLENIMIPKDKDQRDKDQDQSSFFRSFKR